MYTPPRCPHPSCPRHAAPTPDFFIRRGSYKPRCRSHSVPRFQCKTCERGFSRQTFRVDYRDHKPHLNTEVVRLLCSGVGLRQTARLVGLSARNTELKFRKLARQVGWLDRNLKGRAPLELPSTASGETLELHFDEFETYETRRNTRPLSIAVMIESRTRLMVAAVAAPIRPRGTMTEQRKEAIAAEDERFGPRVDRSRVACKLAFRRAARLLPGDSAVLLRTDEKSSYPTHAAEAFGERLLAHETTAGSETRDARNPLFPINHTEAMLRDLVGRVRRDSWLVSKAREFLNLHLGLYSAWRNWVRPRFNRDRRSPGELAGLTQRRLRPAELVGWRQDWGRLSPCPFGCGGSARGSARGSAA